MLTSNSAIPDSQIAENLPEESSKAKTASLLFSNRTSEVFEIKNNLNNYVFDLALFLGGFSANIGNNIAINQDGTINMPKISNNFLVGFSGLNYKKQLDKFILKHDKPIEDTVLYKELRYDPLTSDVRHIFGLIIVTYDSSRGIPEIIQPLVKDELGFISVPRDNMAGVIGIDLHKDKQGDNTPTMTLLHQFRHYITYFGDYIISDDSSSGLNLAFRDQKDNGGFGNSKKLLDLDKGKIELLLDRPIPTDDIFEYKRYFSQLSYLDELHANFIKGDPEWLKANSEIEINGNKCTHHDIAGGHIADSAAIDSLLHVLQKIHCLKYALTEQIEDMDRNQKYLKTTTKAIFQDNHIKAMIDSVYDIIATAGAIVGTSRSILQASQLVNRYWNDYIKEFLVDYAQDAENFQKKLF